MTTLSVPKGLKHKDVITTREGYAPVYVINNEKIDSAWKTFIPHENFYELLDKLLDVFEGRKGRTALWLQGAYGTGKSHACGVLKHLFGDELEEISKYVKGFEKESLRERLLGFRRRNRFLTVALKGEENIPQLEYMEFVLKELIKREAKLRYGIELSSRTEIEKWIEYLKEKGEEWFRVKFGEISNYENLQALIKGLEELNEDAISEVSTVLSKEGIIFLSDFKEWIEEVLPELKRHGISGIFVIWDEFTSLLQKYEEYTTRLQNVLAENPDIYLLIVTHRTEEYYKSRLDKKTLEKIRSRFVFHRYKMEEITTIHILKGVLEKRNRELWERLVINYWSNERIGEIEGEIEEFLKAKKLSLRELYPFHPFTSFLITYTVNHFLSANRSIFDFLYDPTRGTFQDFLEKEVEKEPFLTVDYLWDFFQRVMEEGVVWENARSVNTTYRLYEEKVKKQGDEFLKVFKAVLILNLLMEEVDEPVSLLRPSDSNIGCIFAGTSIEGEVGKILDWIDESGVIRRDGEGNFIVDNRELPLQEVNRKVEELSCKYASVGKILRGTSQEKELYDTLSSELFRELCLTIDGRDRRLSSLLSSELERKPYCLHVVLGIPTRESEISEMRGEYKKLAEAFPNVVFLIVRNYFDAELGRYLEYKAKEEVAARYGRIQDAQYYERQANNILKDIVSSVGESTFFLFNGDYTRLSTLFRVLSELPLISKKIFSRGAENLPLLNSKTVWKDGASPNYLRKILEARNLRELEKESRGIEKQLLDALKDEEGRYLITEDFELKEDVPDLHPFVALYREIVKNFKEREKISPKELLYLKKPPFGVYDRKIYGTLVATVFRILRGNLFTVGRGKSNTEELVKFLESFLKGKEKEHIILRLGDGLEERLFLELKELLLGVLISPEEELTGIDSLRKTVLSHIRKHKGWPLWVLKFVVDDEELKEAVERLDNFFAGGEEDKEKLINIISSHRIDLRRLISDEENFEKGIRRLISLETGLTDGKTIDEIAIKLSQILADEPEPWRESLVKEKIKSILSSAREEREISEASVSPTIAAREPFSFKGLEEVSQSRRGTDITRAEEIDELVSFLKTLSKEELISILKSLAEKYSQVRKELKSIIRYGR